MWEAWDNIVTPTIVRSYILKNLPTDETRKPFFCPSCKEPISFIKEHIKEKGIWRAHFAHHPDSKCEGYVPKGESPEHYEIKMKTLDMISNKTIPIKIGLLSYFLELDKFNIIENETPCIDERRADILLKLKNCRDPIFGTGIVIEIPITETIESIQEKRLDYSKKGYSVATTKDGENITIENTYPEILIRLLDEKKQDVIDFISDQKLLHRDFFKKAGTNNWSCLNCIHALKSNKNKGFISCFRNYKKDIKNYRDIVEKADFTPCEYYKPTNKLPIEEESVEANFTCKKVVK